MSTQIAAYVVMSLVIAAIVFRSKWRVTMIDHTRRQRLLANWPAVVSTLAAVVIIFAFATPNVETLKQVDLPVKSSFVALIDDSGSTSIPITFDGSSRTKAPTRAEVGTDSFIRFARRHMPESGFGLTYFSDTVRRTAEVSTDPSKLPSDSSKVTFEYASTDYEPAVNAAIDQLNAASSDFNPRIIVLISDEDGTADLQLSLSKQTLQRISRENIQLYLVEATLDPAGMQDTTKQLEGVYPLSHVFKVKDAESYDKALETIYAAEGHQTKTVKVVDRHIAWKALAVAA
ncbi:MAG TPA: VWA domain-containing protein [Drouetiella sp.]